MHTVFLDTINEYETIISNFKQNAFPIIQDITEAILNCFQQGGKILLVGNGGSAADCQHIAGELMGRFHAERVSLPAISLAADTSVITCIGNDYNYDLVFARQIEAIANENDILWALSTSGASPNIIKAAQAARKKNIKVVSFTGRKDSLLEQYSDINLCANTNATNHAQGIHQLSYHLICKYLDDNYSK